MIETGVKTNHMIKPPEVCGDFNVAFCPVAGGFYIGTCGDVDDEA